MSLLLAGLAVTSGLLQLKGASDARRASEINADQIRAQWLEEIRRTKYNQKRQYGLARAIAGASGFDMDSGVIQTYLDEMQNVFQKEIDWMYRAMEAGVSAEKMRGQAAYWSGLGGAVGSFASAVGAMSGSFSKTPASNAPSGIKFNPNLFSSPGMPTYNYLNPNIYVPLGARGAR